MAKAKDDKILEQTRGTFKLVGKVTDIEHDNYYRSGILEKGKAQGKEFRSLRFGIQTSPKQKITVQMFGIEPDVVYVWDNEKKKSEAVDYDTFLDNNEQWAEDGKVTFDSTISLDDIGRDAKRLHLPKFDGIEEIVDKLSNGVTIYATGDVTRNQYERNGETVTQTNYDLRQINLNKDIDFDSPDFKEVSNFKEQFVFVEAEHDKEGNQVLVYGKTIDYNENTYPVQYSIPLDENELTDAEKELSESELKKVTKEKEDEYKKRVAMAKAYLKGVKYGDLLTIEGKIVNAVETVMVEDEDDDDDVLGALRGNTTKAVRSYINKLILMGTLDREVKKYTEDDFIKAESKNNILDDTSNDEDDDMGDLGGNKSSDDSPFGNEIDISDDDLPF